VALSASVVGAAWHEATRAQTAATKLSRNADAAAA
jgi:hypothetical protein